MTFKSYLKAPSYGVGHYEEPDLLAQAGLRAAPGDETFVKIWTVHGCPDA